MSKPCAKKGCSDWLVFDTEDNSAELLLAGQSGFDKELTQIAAITENGQHYHNLGNREAFLAWFLKRPEQIAYAHNLQYDIGNLFSKNLDELDQTLVGGRLIKARWRGKVFLDSMNIWPMSVKRLGEAFDLAKLDLNVRSKEYVFRDCEIVWRAMHYAWRFARKQGLERLPTTLGGLALGLWKIWNGQNFHDSLFLSRQAYYGGRTELFAVGGHGSMFYTDLNSLYPFCLCKDFPVSMDRLKGIEQGEGIARVRVQVPRQFVAPLPYRRETDDRIFYPVGTWEGVYTLAELRWAMESGAKILKLFEAYGSIETFQPYRHFVETCYGMRLTSKNAAESLFWKLLMNNLYGRLGLTGIITRSVYLTPDVLQRYNAIPFGTKALISYQMPLDQNVNWAHAAQVTSLGRIELGKYLKLLDQDLIYCDTDSVFFWAKKLPFKTGNLLGEMKLVSRATDAKVFAPKAYKWGKEYKAKGVPKRLARHFLTRGWAEYELPFKMREAIAFYDRGNQKELAVWRKVRKDWKTEYDKKDRKNGQYFPLAISKILQ